MLLPRRKTVEHRRGSCELLEPPLPLDNRQMNFSLRAPWLVRELGPHGKHLRQHQISKSSSAIPHRFVS